MWMSHKHTRLDEASQESRGRSPLWRADRGLANVEQIVHRATLRGAPVGLHM